jgi:hypothetical protein
MAAKNGVRMVEKANYGKRFAEQSASSEWNGR